MQEEQNAAYQAQIDFLNQNVNNFSDEDRAALALVMQESANILRQNNALADRNNSQGEGEEDEEDDEGEESEVHTDDEEESQGEEDDEVERGGGRRRAQERKATAANPVKFALTFKEPKDRAT